MVHLYRYPFQHAVPHLVQCHLQPPRRQAPVVQRLQHIAVLLHREAPQGARARGPAARAAAAPAGVMLHTRNPTKGSCNDLVVADPHC